MRRRVWVVGSAGSGKKSLATALGAKRGAAQQLEWPAAQATIALCSDPERWRGECARGDVVVLVYDLTNRATFDAIANDWAKLVSAQTRTLLVGTRLDCAGSQRRVATAESMELALVECDDCVEVCATRPPFDGVVYARQLLTSWLLAQDNQSPHSPSTPKHGARSSVWLYDPTEEAALAAHDDVKLRPISRALFEMREAGSDRVKMQERRREQAVTKLVTRSRYHGPTESSRSMRWQAHQLQLQQQNSRLAGRRKTVADIDLSLEHAKLETKSFLQPTMLMKQRVEEIRHKLMESSKPPPSRSSLCEESKPKLRKSRQRAMSSAPSVLPPAPVLMAHTRPRAPSLSPPRTSRSRHSLTQLSEIESDEFKLDLVSPPLAPLVLPASPVSQRKPAGSTEAVTPATTGNPPSAPKEPLSPVNDTVKQDQATVAKDEDAFQSTEIDDMLDYFDGVTLPI